MQAQPPSHKRPGLYFTPDRGISNPLIGAAQSGIYRPLEKALGDRVGLSSAAAGWSKDVTAERWSLPPTGEMRVKMPRHRLVATVSQTPTYAAWDDDGRKGEGLTVTGSISVLPESSTTTTAWTSDLSIVSIEFSSALMTRLLDGRDAGAPSEQLIPRRNVPDAIAAGLARGIVAELTTPTERLYGELLCLAMAAHLLRTQGRARFDAPRGRLSAAQSRRVVDYIQANLGQPNLGGGLSIATLAQETGLSEAHFARAFRATFGSSPHQVVLRWRLERAARLIRLEQCAIADAAFAAGFCDQSHMTNAMRRHFGTTPAALLSF